MKPAGLASDFAHLLRRARDGEISHADVLAALDVILHQPGADRTTLLATLTAEQREADTLPPSLILGVLDKINAAREAFSSDDGDHTWHHAPDPTIVRGSAPGTSPRPPIPDRDIGGILKDRFELLERIGHGGMSTVYKAIDRRKSEALLSEPNVAVKIIRRDLGEHRDLFAVLQRETQKAQSLGHPNIVRVFDCDRDGTTVFMTMEYLAGKSLSRNLSALRNDATQERALKIIADVGSALTFAHRHGVVHGDLKPSNVIITDEGDVKVIDFGIARLLPHRAAQKGSAREPPLSAATPAYASPEMLDGKEPDPRDDVYALACVAYTVLTGRHPFDREPSNLARDANMRPAPHRDLTSRQYKALAAALAFDREHRTPTVEQLVADLQPPERARNVRAIAVGGALAALAAVATIAAIVLDLGPRSDRSEAGSPAEGALAASANASGDVFRDCDTCPRMKPVPTGTFVQGAATGEGEASTAETPARSVAIGRPFAVGVYEVTLAEYAAFAEETERESTGCATYDGDWRVGAARGWRDAAYSQGPSHPVTCVSWDDAAAYASWLSAKTGRPYRLPSASEWEYVARGGERPDGETATHAACHNGNVADRTAAERYEGWTVHDCTDGYIYTAPVGSFAPNAFGLYDTIGNAFEWVADCWHDDYRGAPTDGSAWLDGDCSLHELRGGSWFTEPSMANGASRNRFAADYRSNTFGFRVAKEIAE